MQIKVSKDNFKLFEGSILQAISEMSTSGKRRYLGKLAIDLGKGGMSLVSKNLPISRTTLRKGVKEVKSGVSIKDKFEERGRLKAEEKLPNLLSDIQSIVDPASQTDPSLKSTRLYTRLTSSEVRQQLLKLGYEDSELPTKRTILTKMKDMGYSRTKVVKTKPKKKLSKPNLFFQN